jgi:hypothetical protein
VIPETLWPLIRGDLGCPYNPPKFKAYHANNAKQSILTKLKKNNNLRIKNNGSKITTKNNNSNNNNYIYNLTRPIKEIVTI